MARTAPCGELVHPVQGSGGDLCALAATGACPHAAGGGVSRCGFTVDMVFGAREPSQTPLLYLKGRSVTRLAVLQAEGLESMRSLAAPAAPCCAIAFLEMDL